MTECFELVDVALISMMMNSVFTCTLTRRTLNERTSQILRQTAFMKSHASMTFPSVNTVPSRICAVEDGRALTARTYQGIGSWLPKALFTRKSLRLFFKKSLDTSPITARSLQKPYYVKSDEFERSYKDHLSDFRTWKHKFHAQ